MTELHILTTDDGHTLLHAPTESAMKALELRYHAANSIGYRIISAMGGGAEQIFLTIPAPMRRPVELATLRALEQSFDLAARHRLLARAQVLAGPRVPILASALGAIGGMGGLPTAMAELPLSTVLMMRQIQNVAVLYGFDPAEPETRKDSLQIFAGSGPVDGDSDLDLGFVSARVTLTGVSLNAMLQKIAPRVAALTGQRLAAKSVPILGAAAGAATNYSFIRYHEHMAHLMFGLRRMAEDSATPLPDLVEDLRGRVRRSSRSR